MGALFVQPVREPGGTSAAQPQSQNTVRGAIQAVTEITQPNACADFAWPSRARDPGSDASRPIAPRAAAPKLQNTGQGDNYGHHRSRALIGQPPQHLLPRSHNPN